MKIIFILFFTLISFKPVFGQSFYFENDSSVPIVEFSLAFRTGAGADPELKQGLTNLTAEMLLRGTQLRKKSKLEQAFDELGSTIEMDIRSELTIVRASVLSKNIQLFLELVKEVLTEPKFDSQEFLKLKKQITSVLLSSLGSDAFLAQRGFDHFFFKKHPYSHYSMGSLSGMKFIQLVDIQNQYPKIFNKNDPILVGSGDTSSDVMEKWFDSLKSKLNSSNYKQILPAFQPPPQLQVLIVDKPDRTQNTVVIGHIGKSFKDKDYFSFYLGNFGFGGRSFNARLLQEIRVKRGWTYGISTSMSAGSQPKEWSINYTPTLKDTVPSIKHIISMVNDLKNKGLTEAEYLFSKKNIVNSSKFSSNTPSKRVENKLIEMALDLPSGFFSNLGSEVKKSSLKEVNESLANNVYPNDLKIIIVGDGQLLKPQIINALRISSDNIFVKNYKEF